MSNPTIKTSSLYSRLVDLLVLAVSFLLFAYITEYESQSQLWIDLFFYVSVVFISLRLSKRFIFERIHTENRIACVLLGNITGLLFGAVLAILLESFFPGNGEVILVVVFSSIMAFFILGTLSPMVKSSHNDIIHH